MSVGHADLDRVRPGSQQQHDVVRGLRRAERVVDRDGRRVGTLGNVRLDPFSFYEEGVRQRVVVGIVGETPGPRQELTDSHVRQGCHVGVGDVGHLEGSAPWRAVDDDGGVGGESKARDGSENVLCPRCQFVSVDAEHVFIDAGQRDGRERAVAREVTRDALPRHRAVVIAIVDIREEVEALGGGPDPGRRSHDAKRGSRGV